MKVMGVLLLTLSGVTPAASVFVGVPDIFAQAGTGAALSLIAGALLVVPIAFIYAELSSAFPVAGGEYVMTGRTLGPAAGYAVLGLTAFLNMLTPAVLALGIAPYLDSFLPALDDRVWAVGVIVVTTLLGVLHIRTNAWVTGVFLALELAALAVLAVLGFGHAVRPASELIAHPVLLNGNALAPASLAAIGLSSSVSVYVFNGFGGAVYFAEEQHDAPRRVATTILWAGAITVAAIVIPVVAVLMGAPDLKDLFSAKNPFGDFIAARGGPVLATAVNIAIAVAILNAVLATILQNGRFFFSTGRDGAWHPMIDRMFLLTHPRFHSPWAATLAAGATAVAACFLGLEKLLMLSGAGLTVTYLVLCWAVIMGRRNGSTLHAPRLSLLHPILPVLGIAGVGFILWMAARDSDNGRPGLIAAAASIGVSLVYYWAVVRRRGAWTIRNPEEG
jgi:amino acid transporter